jgi:hypothetical protein
MGFCKENRTGAAKIDIVKARTIDTGHIAVGRHLNLDHVQRGAVDFVPLSFHPFEHV